MRSRQSKEAQWRFAVTVSGRCRRSRDLIITRPDEEQPYYDSDDPRISQSAAGAVSAGGTRASCPITGCPSTSQQEVQTNERVPGIGDDLESAAGRSGDLRDGLAPAAGAVPLGTKSFAFTCTVHSNVKGPAQGVAAPEAAGRMALDAGRSAVLLRARRRRSDHRVFRLAGRGEARRLHDHRGRRIQRQAIIRRATI